MPRLQVDTSEAMSFEPVEPGTYECTVSKIEGPEKGPNSDYVTAYFEPDDVAVLQRAGHFRKTLPINGKGAGFFREFWKATTGEDLAMGEDEIDVDTDDAIGRPVVVSITNEEYEGALQNVVGRVVAAS